MRLFLRKILLFFVLYLAISLVISFFTPYHWGNPWYSTKVQFLEKNTTENYNTFFFGSSRIYRQINPQKFDATLDAISNKNISSFNLGAPATFTPQCYYLYDNFLESPLSDSVKYCFMELMPVDLLGDYFMHQERTTYWQNLSDFLFVEKSIWNNKNLGRKQQIKTTFNYTISYIENALHLGHFGQQIVKKDYYNKKYIGTNKKGFFPLDYDYKTATDPVIKESLSQRREAILNDPQLIIELNTNSSQLYNNPINTNIDKVHLDRIEQLIAKSKEKGIHLSFVISPRNVSQKLLNLASKIPPSHLIDMGNPQKYKDLYQKENFFDKGHLNSKGANLYSKLIAIEFDKNIN